MLISFLAINNAKKNYDNSIHSQIKHGASSAFYTTILLFASILFFFEIIALLYAVQIAVKCSREGPERICHLILSVFFTYPYLLIALFFSKCAKKL